ncbi:dihydrofolate reductase family protein [Staphylococcus borealis]|uniref:dihydrofolate reductase family protein n=1 Tax=Staphylococcus borealis TaxID=2742203 RepID=UPI000FF3F23D|nr:dihydrofolate reductase family protein [Staphylococcus borealis]MDM7862496.1 dihydrofolate reductase family protein [Staphylococcus borealis]MDM7881308.1 dihydrofolate reductase family protein [Staphylococcus borealis]RIO91886.1 dihydrofolate reductase [Staphylococcus haemolyticus]
MSANICAYLGVSVDGYIADQYESVQFLEEVEGEGDNGYAQFYDSVDVVIMGGNTFRWLLDNGVKTNPYEGKRVIVMSTQHVMIDWDIEFYSGDLKQLFTQFNNDALVWIVGGGALISELVNLNMLTSMRLTLAPNLLGQGISLFNDIKDNVHLTLRDVTQYNQFVELNYDINYK